MSPLDGDAQPFSKESQTRKRPYGVIDVDAAWRRYQAGETTVQIAATYGVSATAVQQAFNRRGYRLIPHWERQPYPENLARANEAKKAKTHCKNGHEYTSENTYFNNLGGRGCKTCVREQAKQWKRKNRAKIQANRPPAKKPDREFVACVGCGDRRLMYPLKEGQQRWCQSCRTIQLIGTGEQRICPCGAPFYARRRKSGKLAEYCTIDCRITYGGYAQLGRTLSLQRGGDGNPAYKHGRRIDIQIPGWRLNNKGERKCRNCGSTKGRIELHHAIPRSKARHVKADLRNGIPLCMDCHRGWHAKKVTLYRDIFTPDEWAFVSSVELTGERIEAWLDRHYPSR